MSACNAGDPGSIPRSGRYPGEGNHNPLQYSCLENPMDGGAWKAAVHVVARSRTRLSDFTFTFHFHALEKEVATHSSVLAWRIPGTGEPGGLPSMGSHRVRHDWSNLAAFYLRHILSNEEFLGKCKVNRGFSGPAVENLSCNAGDKDSIPAQRTKSPQASGQLSLCPTSRESVHHSKSPPWCSEDALCHNYTAKSIN